jgi:hypothetical protein
MPNAIKKQVSETYEQLAKIFKHLEVAAFEEGIDFGENLEGRFQWFISPSAALYLEKRFFSDMEKLRANSRFICKKTPWTGIQGAGLDINLVL